MSIHVKLQKVQERLLADGRYATPGDFRPVLIDRALGTFDWWYYFRFLQGIVGGGMDARLWRRFDDAAWSRRAAQILHAVERCGGSVTIEGAHHIKDHDGPVVFAANHMGILDTIIVPMIALPFGHPTVVVKESLLNYPVFGPAMRACRPIAVKRENAREDLKLVLKEGQASLARGDSVVMFPQATRTPWFDAQAFNTLAVKLAERAGVCVIPIALRTDFMGIGKRIKDCGPIDRTCPVIFKIGAPIATEGRGREAQADLVTFISKALADCGVKDREESRDT